MQPSHRSRSRPTRWLLALAAHLGLGLPAAAQVPEDGQVHELDGEHCLACDTRVEGEGVLLVHRGRRVYLHLGDCADHWNEDTDALFAALQPHGALWDEAETTAPLLGGWFWFGVYVLAGLVFGAASAFAAIDRGRPAAPWFFLGLALNVIAFTMILTKPRVTLVPALEGVPAGLRKVPVTHSPVLCECGAENHPSASSCSVCGAALSPRTEAEAERARGGSAR